MLATAPGRGARRIADVPGERVALLECGADSTRNHIEHMAIDQERLWSAAAPAARERGHELAGLRFIARLRHGGRMLVDALGDSAWTTVGSAEPDTVRAWRAFAVGAADLPLVDRLRAIRPFALDDHFAVREWAWLAVRDAVCADPRGAIGLLDCGLRSEPTRWRRFAAESTRPRGVWGRHIPEFKREPELGWRLLMQVICDDDPYVRTSAVNWLNDAERTAPGFASSICLALPPGPRRDVVLRRATRSVRRTDTAANRMTPPRNADAV